MIIKKLIRTAMLLAIFSCTKEDKGPVAPENDQVSYYKSSTVTDSMGTTLSGVRVNMYLLYDNDIKQPKANYSFGYSYTLDYRVRIFDMFDNQIKMVSKTYYCEEYSFCTGFPPSWDLTDFNGDTVSKGLYYLNIITSVPAMNRYDSSGAKTWICSEGFIDSTDENGVYQIPPVPVNKNIGLLESSSVVNRFNGWLYLTFEKDGYVNANDTCFFGDSIITPVILHRQ